MRLDELTVFNTLGGAMRYHAERTKVLAQNVANAQTPQFIPSDIADGDVGAALASRRFGASSHGFGGQSIGQGEGMARTHSAHMTGLSGGKVTFRVSNSPDSETNLNGNAVVIEEQMMKMSETRLAYDTAVGLYNKSLAMVRTAMRSPSG